MARKWLRFPLRSEEQLRIRADLPITVLDGAPSFPDRLRLEFTIFDPTGGAPPLMPLFPGAISFLADPGAPGVAPTATDSFTWTSSQYDTWKTVGTLSVELHPTLATEIAALPGAPAPVPSIAWYWPVRLTQPFLFDAIRTHLIKDDVRRAAGGLVTTSDAMWPQHAVAGFLAGTHKIQLRGSADPLDDDAVKHLAAMPTVEMNAAGEVGLWVATAAGTGVDDGQPLPAPAGTTPRLDPAHPGSALLPARKTLTDLAAETLGAEQPGSTLAAAVLSPWPSGPRYFQVAFTSPGLPRRPYRAGTLPSEEVTVRDAAGVILQQRRLSTAGLVTVAQEPTTPTPAPPRISVAVTRNALRIGATTGSRTAPGADTVGFDFGVLPTPGRVSLQPPAPAPVTAASKRAYSGRLASLCIRAAHAPTTKQAVEESLAEYERTLRPAGWSPADLLFRGTRAPWAGTRRTPAPLKADDLRALFDALQSITVNGVTAPSIRPGEALLLWMMEGRAALLDRGLLLPGQRTEFEPVLDHFAPPDHPFTGPVLAAAAEADVQKLVRTMLLWNFFGLDQLAEVTWNAAAGDTLLTWGSTPAASMPAHDAALTAGLAAIAAAGIGPPTVLALTDAIEVSKLGSGWWFRLKAEFVETYVWAQYAEYLRRLVTYTLPARTAPHPPLPLSARELPAFSYIAFNALRDERRAAELWARANLALAGGPPAWVQNAEDALRSWPLEADEILRTPRGSMDRSKAVRVNGLHFAALVRSFGAVMPPVLYPSA